jgi:hypothetical protein
MEQMLETIDLDSEESNELAFRVKVEGAEQAPSKIRLVCESGELAYMFNGRTTSEDGVILFTLPSMKGKLKEGVYSSKIEVLIENRYFAPVQFNINFKKTMTVVAEAISIQPRKKPVEITVTAQPVIVAKPIVPQVATPVIQKPAIQAPILHKQPVQVQSTRSTLSEKFKTKPVKINEEITKNDESALRELVGGFIKTQSRKKR